MNNSLPDSTSAKEPRQQTYQFRDQRFTVAFWMMKYATYLFRTSPYGTYERYTRALDKLFAAFPEKRFLHEFRRVDLEDYKKQRLESGTSPKTVNIEFEHPAFFLEFPATSRSRWSNVQPCQRCQREATEKWIDRDSSERGNRISA
jgi:hypothetical protein